MGEQKSPILNEVPEQLEGERITVRAYRPGDGAPLWEAVEESRDHIVPWLPWGPAHAAPADSEAYVRRSISRFTLREDLPFGIWLKGSDRLLGGTGLHRIDWDVPSFEIGYWLRRSAQGRGYMTEAVSLLMALAFEQLAANRLEIHVAEGNHRSAAVPQRLGFVHEAVLEASKRITTGELVGMHIYRMLGSEYKRP